MRKMEFPEKLLSHTSFLMAKCAYFLSEETENVLKEYGIRPKHYAILLLLEEYKDVNQKEVGNTLFLDRNTMVLLADDLEKLEFIRRQKNPKDRRAYFLVLSEKGEKAIQAMNDKLISSETQQLSFLNKKERKQLNEITKKIIGQALAKL